MLVTLLGDVRRSYADLRGFQDRLSIAEQNIAVARDTVSLTQSLARAGQATQRDVAQAESQLESVSAQVPVLRSRIALSIHRLAVLTGQQPQALDAELAERAPGLIAPPDVPTGLPSDVREHRPDIQRPGATGRRHRPHQRSQGRLLAIQDARAKQASAVVQSTLLGALEETENALVNYACEQDRCGRLEAAVRASQTALELANVQYRAGLTYFLTVLDSERDLYGSQDLLAASQAAIATDLIALYKALGGGWPISPRAAAN